MSPRNGLALFQSSTKIITQEVLKTSFKTTQKNLIYNTQTLAVYVTNGPIWQVCSQSSGLKEQVV